MQLFLTDSKTKKKILFVPQKPPFVNMYVCGPTVYDDAHLGHARSAISFDLLYRLLLELGFKVKYARNITDIDDKILAKMKSTGKSLQEITQFYQKRFEEEMNQIGVLSPSVSPKATENIEPMQDLVDLLLEKNVAYQTLSGDIYLDTSKDKEYGKLSSKTQEDAKSRVDFSGKKNPKDFVLWKKSQPNDKVFFDYKMGSGRPGWHIECSAMIKKHLDNGGEFLCDIHGGGEDLFFPHHENEDSQCRCGYNRPLAKYWLHNGFVQIDGEKMSKSLGNSFFLKDALKEHQGEAIRFYLASTYYRNDFSFNTQDLSSSTKRLDKIYRLKMKLIGQKSSQPSKKFKEEFLSALCDDLNVSVALSLIDTLVKESNEKIEKNPKDRAFLQETLANIELINRLLGVGKSDPYEFFQYGLSEEFKAKVQNLLEKRQLAKKEKKYKLADEIREELKSLGVKIMDTATKVLWEKI